MVSFKCYFSGELIALSLKNILKKQQQRCEHRIRKNKQMKSTVHDANKKNEVNKLCVNKQRQSMKIKSICRNQSYQISRYPAFGLLLNQSFAVRVEKK